MKTQQILELLFDGHNGIYIPQLFAKHCNPENSYWVWSYQQDGEILLNPDHAEYWEVWQDVVDTAYYLDPSTNVKYFLQEWNGDLWAIKEGYSIDENEQIIDENGNAVEL